MQISLREFELFVAIMDLGSLTAAADALGMSQPAASKLLKALEQRLGLELFRRQKKALGPTSEALALYPGFVDALSSMAEVTRNAENLRRGHVGQVQIATNPAIASTALPLALGSFRTLFPGISVSVRTRTTVEICEALSRQRADVGITYEPTADPRLIIEPLRTIEVGVLLHPTHPLCVKDEIHLSDLAQYPLIALGKAQPVGAALRKLMNETELIIPVTIEVTQSNVACACVQAGFGVAVLDGLGLREGRIRGLETRLLSPRATVKISLVRSVNQTGSRVVGRLCECIRNAFHEF